MSRETYKKLVRETCLELAIESEPEFLDQPNQALASGVSIGTIPIVIGYILQEEKEQIYIYCTFGLLPEENRDVILLTLMEINFFLFRANPPVFFVEPLSCNVVFAYTRQLSELTSMGLAADLQNLAHTATEWRQSYFLEDQGSKTKANLMANFA